MGSVGLTKLVLSTPHRIIASKRSLEQLQPPPMKRQVHLSGYCPLGCPLLGCSSFGVLDTLRKAYLLLVCGLQLSSGECPSAPAP